MSCNLKSIQYTGLTVFFIQTRGANVFGDKTGHKNWTMSIGIGLLMFAPIAQLVLLLVFAHSWKTGDNKREV